MRVPFNQIFITNPNGSINPRTAISIKDVTMGPGVNFTRGVLFGGFDVFSILGMDLEVTVNNGITSIDGIYK